MPLQSGAFARWILLASHSVCKSALLQQAQGGRRRCRLKADLGSSPSLPPNTAAAPSRAASAATSASIAVASPSGAGSSAAGPPRSRATPMVAAKRGQARRGASTAATSREAAGGEPSRTPCSSSALAAQVSAHAASCGQHQMQVIPEQERAHDRVLRSCPRRIWTQQQQMEGTQGLG